VENAQQVPVSPCETEGECHRLVNSAGDAGIACPVKSIRIFFFTTSGFAMKAFVSFFRESRNSFLVTAKTALSRTECCAVALERSMNVHNAVRIDFRFMKFSRCRLVEIKKPLLGLPVEASFKDTCGSIAQRTGKFKKANPGNNKNIAI